MIKINFLQEEAVHAVDSEPVATGLPPARQTAVFLASLLVALALTGALYWFWNRQLNRLSQDLAAEQHEAARLSAVQAENQRFQQRVSEAERRLDTVRSLQNQRVGPVALMNALGELVNRTTGLYLLTVNAEGGRLQIQGQSDSLEAIVNFIGVLRHSGSFADVQFHQFFQDDQEKRLSFKFNLDCVYQPAATPTTARPGSGVVQTAAAAPAGNAAAPVVR
jgi:Tfp pilus assembly protein PilN